MGRVPRRAFIVSHTHWDREWYLTYHSFRVHLVGVVQKILDVLENDDSFRHFVMDGQSVILEDYLEACPWDRERIKALVATGSLSIGPWYVLPDEFLVSGEATVRNLLLGHKVCGELGGAQKVGYLPDSFGHIAQMPQILSRAGIDSFIYTRGNGDELDDLGCEYLWEAPDGSEVLAINQCAGYYNAASLGFAERWHAHTQRELSSERAVLQVGELFSEIGKLSNGDVYLLNNGSDHLPPQCELGAMVDALRRAYPETEFVHTSFAEYVKAVRSEGIAKKRYAGEMLAGKRYHILSGVWSARIHLKQQNDTAQEVLSSCLEPFSTYMHFVLGRPYRQGLIQHAWKLLMKNHPHDSICGCSTDQVHREMEPRFAGVIDTGEQILRGQLEHLAPSFGRRPDDDSEVIICVANPLPVRRTEVVERLLVLPVSYGEGAGFDLRDESGRSVPYTVVDRKYVKRFWGVDFRSQLFYERQRELYGSYLEHFRNQIGERPLTGLNEKDLQDCFVTIQFLAEDLPALGHTVYHLTEREAPGRADALRAGVAAGSGTISISENPIDPVSVTANTIENGHYRVTLNENGTFDLVEKASGVTLEGLNLLEDTEDVGDESDYSPSPNPQTVRSDGAPGEVRVLENTGLRGRLEVKFPLWLPESVTSDRSRRSTTLTECAVTTRIGLCSRGRVVDVELLFDNRARDHRLRVGFPTTITSDTVVSDGHFYVNERPLDQPSGSDWVQPPTNTYPQQEYTLVRSQDLTFGLLNRGLPEIAATRDSLGRVVLHLTLVRSVGWLSRDDFVTRRHSNAGPTLITPEAQCLGPHRFRYAVVAFASDHDAPGIAALSREYRIPVLTKQGVKDQSVGGGVSFITKLTDSTSISAIKKHEARDTVVVRLYNLTDAPLRERLVFGARVSSAWQADLLENRVTELPVTEGRELCIGLGPHEIVTLELEISA